MMFSWIDQQDGRRVVHRDQYGGTFTEFHADMRRCEIVAAETEAYIARLADDVTMSIIKRFDAVMPTAEPYA